MHSTLQPGQDHPSLRRALAQRAKVVVPKTHSMTSSGPSRVHKLTSSTCPGGQVDLVVVVKPQNFGQLLSRPVAGPKQGRDWGLGGGGGGRVAQSLPGQEHQALTEAPRPPWVV